MSQAIITVTDQSRPADPIPSTRAPVRSTLASALLAYGGMVLRDLVVLNKNLKRFLPSAIVQPTLLIFVFAYLFPHIHQGVGGASGAARFSTLLLPGIVANSIIFVGIFRVGMNLVFEMESDEFEDRVVAPAPIATAAVAKITAASLHALFAGLLVFPIAVFLPATSVQLQPNWPVLLTIVPLACMTAAALGLALGVLFSPEQGPWLFSVVALPVSFFGAVFYTWQSLSALPAMQYAVLINPLVYMSEGLRAALVPGVAHMPLAIVYLALIAFTGVFIALGLAGFRRQMLS